MAINMASSYGKDAQQTMQDMVLPGIYDQVTTDNPLLGLALKNAKGKMFGGKQLRVPIKYKNTGQGGFYSGLDTFKTNKIRTKDAMLFDPKFLYQSITLENTEVSMSGTANNAVDIIMDAIEENAIEMGENLGIALHGTGLGSDGKAISGLIAGCDDGTIVSTYGGLDRTAGAGTAGNSIKGHLDATAYTTGGTKFSLTALRTLLDSCDNGKELTDLMLTSTKVFNIIEALLPTATLNYSPWTATNVTTQAGQVPAMTAYAGYKQIFYKGIPIIKDKQMNSENGTDDHLFAIHTPDWIFPLVDMYNANILNMVQNILKGGIENTNTNMGERKGFFMTKFKEPADQGANIAQLLFGGNFICTSPRNNGYFSSING